MVAAMPGDPAGILPAAGARGPARDNGIVPRARGGHPARAANDGPPDPPTSPVGPAPGGGCLTNRPRPPYDAGRRTRAAALLLALGAFACL